MSVSNLFVSLDIKEKARAKDERVKEMTWVYQSMFMV
jgi:hypothetical protein